MVRTEDILSEYREKRKKIVMMGGLEAVEKQHKRGKMTARERIQYFFDPETFTEIGTFVRHRTTAFGMDKRKAAEDYTSMAGTFGEYHGKKFAQAIDFAMKAGIPFLGMNDSGGARLHEGMDSLQAYAWLFRSQIIASGVIPQIALLMGPCLGGQAYHPIMQDFVFTQTGEDISLEELCGVEAHAVKSGQTDVVAENDEDCLDKAKELLAFLPSNNREKPPRLDTDDDPERRNKELQAIVPTDPGKPFDMHEVINRIVDNEYFFERQASHCIRLVVWTVMRRTKLPGL
jgi:acetyl-CoA carboxylase carboxyltransferase component